MTTEKSLTLRVLTLNTWGLRAPIAKDRDQRMQNIGGYLAGHDYDVVALQEVWSRRSLPPILMGAAASGLHYHHVYAARGFGSGLVLLSRYPIVDVHFQPFSLRGGSVAPFGAEANARKGIAFATVMTPAGPVDVYVTHLIAQYEVDDAHDVFAHHRAGQIYTLAQAILHRRGSQHHRAEHPTIICGDFNLQPHQWTYAFFTAMTDAEDCLAVAHHGSIIPTYNNEDNPYASGDSERLDYIFTLPGREQELVTVDSQVVMRTRQRHSTESYSDHDAVMAVLEVRPRTDAADHAPARQEQKDVRHALLAQFATSLNGGLLRAQRSLSRGINYVRVLAAILILLTLFWNNRRWQKAAFWLALLGLIANGWRSISAANERVAFDSLLAQVDPQLTEHSTDHTEPGAVTPPSYTTNN